MHENTAITDVKVFAETILSVSQDSPAYRKLWEDFGTEMNKALQGRICTRERMAALYPIFREINLETDIIDYECRLSEAADDLVSKVASQDDIAYLLDQANEAEDHYLKTSIAIYAKEAGWLEIGMAADREAYEHWN